MKIISFDIGIKNMALCIIDCSASIQIENWNILNLIEDEKQEDVICNQNGKSTKKKCTSKAKFKKGNQFFCKKHATSSSFMIPTKDLQLTKLKNKKKEDLLQWGKQHYLFLEDKSLSKQEMVSTVDSYLKAHCLEELIKPKIKASQCDLISIGRAMKELLNAFDLNNVDYAIIENQISPIANRMTTIQGMLAQYFIMKYPHCNIEFISSANKLKPFSKMELIEKPTEDKGTTTKNVNPNYKAHKQDSVSICSTIVANNFSQWSTSLEIKKKDDLADAFLQGLWYLFHKNNISYADDLKINIVSLS
jgi:hypothetical protein